MTELALRDASAVALQPDYVIQRSGGIYERDVIDGWVQVLDDVSRLANFIAETDFVPRALRNRPAAVTACILTGRELGIGPMQSLKSIHMVQGVPSLAAEYKRARALAAGHDITFDETNSTRCIIRGRRAGTERWVTIQWNIDMARRAKLAGKDVWQQYPQRMLQARASSELCDLLFPDASLGLATMEVLEDGGIVTESGEIVDAATGELTTSATPAIEAARPRTARRAAPKNASPAPAAQSAASATPPPSQGAGEALPPLPGEDEDPTTSGASSSAPAPASGSPQRTAEPSPSTSSGSATTPDDTDYDTHGTATRGKGGQLTALWTILTKEFGYADTEADKTHARTVCEYIINRQLDGGTTGDLSRNEARTVLDTLSHWQHQAAKEKRHPREYMTALMMATDEAAEGE